ncbi:MAG: GMC oxidoreductase [Gemmatimonadota bacterium]
MSRTVLVVGSGASAVHFAQSVLARGWAVTMLDIGFEGAEPTLPDAHFGELKEQLDDPVRYLLGDAFEGALLPGTKGEYYGTPPSQAFVFRELAGHGFDAAGFTPLFSWARGGLAGAWTGGCYPFNDDDLADFPFDYDALDPYYSEVSRRIGISGDRDDLARFLPVHEHLLAPLDLDEHSMDLVAAYRRRRPAINRLGCYVGRTRVATLTRPLHGRDACGYLGRCLWGCPLRALYTPAHTLEELRRYPDFEYRPGWRVRRFRYADGRVECVVAEPLDGGPVREFTADRIVLGAGALNTAEIVLRSVHEATGERVRLTGLMDNRQVLVPFVNWRMIGRPVHSDRYQYHLLGLGLSTPDAREYVHCQVTTLKAAMMHPITQRLPFDLATAAAFTRLMHSSLGLINLNFHDTRRDSNTVSLEPADDGTLRLALRYEPDLSERSRMRSALGRIRRALRLLGCIVPPGLQHVRPMGASVHYAGMLPMADAGRFTTDANGRSRDWDNLWIVDGSTFPFLPAKNITFTLMANAARIAENAF